MSGLSVPSSKSGGQVWTDNPNLGGGAVPRGQARLTARHYTFIQSVCSGLFVHLRHYLDRLAADGDAACARCSGARHHASGRCLCVRALCSSPKGIVHHRRESSRGGGGVAVAKGRPAKAPGCGGMRKESHRILPASSNPRAPRRQPLLASKSQQMPRSGAEPKSLGGRMRGLA